MASVVVRLPRRLGHITFTGGRFAGLSYWKPSTDVARGVLYRHILDVLDGMGYYSAGHPEYELASAFVRHVKGSRIVKPSKPPVIESVTGRVY